jgi:hypothetical protein
MSMSQTEIAEYTRKLIASQKEPTPKEGVRVKNSAGEIVFDARVGRAWNGYVVKSIGAILVDGSPPINEFDFSWTYEIKLAGKGGVVYSCCDDCDPLAPIFIGEPPPKAIRALYFNDNEVEFSD